MKIALLGYGRMGKAIEKILVERGHTAALKVDVDNRKDVTDKQLKGCDVAIDFSTAAVTVENCKWCFDNGVPVVSGTTGWLTRWDELTDYCRVTKGTFFYASNFSIGVNIVFQLNQELAKRMSKFTDYHAFVEEIHHVHKLDAPSGTAITLAEGITKNHSAYQSWELVQSKDGDLSRLQGRDDDLRSKELKDRVLPVTAVREGEVPGIHSITYKSPVDEISIRHEAFSREGFALGAVLAAEFLKGKSNGVFGMEDLLK
ncbi:4-hydroxy-tetrahydrodipicolinate reductase [Bacteroidia bacterium]|nr:4-hydroxy-tetrahydrodipicolinate reductase [Bacteroidia bacterium]